MPRLVLRCASAASLALSASVSAFQVEERVDGAWLNAQVGAMHAQPMQGARVKVLADMLSVPTERLGELAQCEAVYLKDVDALGAKAREIAAAGDVGVLLWNADQSQVPQEDRARVYDDAMVKLESVLRDSGRARDAYFACLKGLGDPADVDRLRAFDLLAAGMVAGTVGNPSALPDLVELLYAGARRNRAYAAAVPAEGGASWDLALAAVREESRARDAGEQARAIDAALVAWLTWRAELKGELLTRFRQPRWEELHGEGSPGGREWKRMQPRREGSSRHAEAIAVAIESTLGGEAGGRAAREWRRDVRSSQWPQYFGDGELDRTRAFLGRLRLDEATATVVAVALDGAAARLDAADAAVADALAAAYGRGVSSPPGQGPEWRPLVAAAKARVGVLDQAVSALGALLVGTEHEDRWRAFVIEMQEERTPGYEWETS